MYRVLLATRSPLYAPIYHAWANAPRTFREKLELDFSLEEQHGDDLVSQTLGHYGENSVLLAIGDLTRILPFIKQSGFDEPRILGGFIDKMCLWLVTRNQWVSEKIPQDCRRHVILSHPEHMTTYRVANYYMQKIAQCGDDDAVNKHIFPVVSPGFEKDYYQIWRMGGRIRDCHLAYMSSEIPHQDRGEEAIISFSEEEEFGDVSMTGLFTSANMFTYEHSMIQEFCGRVKESIQLLSSDGDRVPYDLYSNGELVRKTGLHHDYKYLCKLRRKLVRINGYSTNLALSEGQLGKMLAIKFPDNGSQIDSDLAALWGFCAPRIPAKEPQPTGASRQLCRALSDRELVRRQLIAVVGPLVIFRVTTDRRFPLRVIYLIFAVWLLLLEDASITIAGGYALSHKLIMGILVGAASGLIAIDAVSLGRRVPAVPIPSFLITLGTVLVILNVLAETYPSTFWGNDNVVPTAIGMFAFSIWLVLSRATWERLSSAFRSRWTRWRVRFHALRSLVASYSKLSEIKSQ
jgi:hypothetical protein